MKKYGVNELRKMFLDFYGEQRTSWYEKLFSLVPQDDKSFLLINAGMAPLKPYFTGAENSAENKSNVPVRNVSVQVILRM